MVILVYEYKRSSVAYNYNTPFWSYDARWNITLVNPIIIHVYKAHFTLEARGCEEKHFNQWEA
jgi:hypothetical protein